MSARSTKRRRATRLPWPLVASLVLHVGAAALCIGARRPAVELADELAQPFSIEWRVAGSGGEDEPAAREPSAPPEELVVPEWIEPLPDDVLFPGLASLPLPRESEPAEVVQEPAPAPAPEVAANEADTAGVASTESRLAEETPHVEPASAPEIVAAPQEHAASDSNERAVPAPEPPLDAQTARAPSAGSAAGTVGAFTSARPDARRNETPEYPKLARQRRLQGTAVLSVVVRADGSVADVELLESSGHDVLDQASIAAVRKWKFVAATRGGVAVESTVEVPVTWRLVKSARN